MADEATALRPAPPPPKPKAERKPRAAKAKAPGKKRGRKPAAPQRSAADQIKLMRALMKLAKQL